MVILTKERICIDCCCRFVAANGKGSVRCPPCQKLFVKSETRDRDNARRTRQKAGASICKVIGMPRCDVLRDNGHRCHACGRVLFLSNGRAAHYCHECRPYSDAASMAIDVLSFIVETTIQLRCSCVVCGDEVPPGRATTCSTECSNEQGRRKSRLKYELATGVRLRPASGDRPCRLCDRIISPDVALGRGRSVCDYCNLHRRTFKARAMMYGVRYEHVSRAAVFRRDGWRCQLCRKKVLKKAKRCRVTKRLHPRTASLDHIVPMARGGPHVQSNVQCACLQCNVRKNAKMIGQRRLF
jgi:5-methylcytosine-specific restriction endonuclease McrA